MSTEDDPQVLFGDAEDLNILMHRDAHFGGSFPLMLDYYRKPGKGVQMEFEIEKIENLAEEELRLGKNIAPLLFTAKEAEEVKKALDAYDILRKIYSSKNIQNKFPRLIADLILSEDEAEKEIEAIVKEKSAIVPSLIELIRSDDFYNPLFPGYGKAYQLAAKCLGKIGDKRAIISLFESIGKGNFFEDEISLNALKAIGLPAKTFLLQVLNSFPLNEDNEKAAISLLAFEIDEEIGLSCFTLLKKIDVKKDSYLATYLILASEGLKDPILRKEFEKFSESADLSKELKNDFKVVLDAWKQQ